MPRRTITQIGLKGADELLKKFKILDRLVDEQDIENGLLHASRIIATKAKQLAPLGPTGNLRRGIVAKKFQKKRKGNPAVFCGIDYRIAPHAHLVEFGHIAANGRHVGARPFFRRAIKESKDLVLFQIAQTLKRAIKKVGK